MQNSCHLKIAAAPGELFFHSLRHCFSFVNFAKLAP